MLSKQALHTLKLLHAELAGKALANKAEAVRLRSSMDPGRGRHEDAGPGFQRKRVGHPT
ncbi:hypothetical protein [Bradyrhizobium genosp. P]|uniref:hypothetical protein n=1 Tax=Bradyrhizobium genosp. P TaxID=83641 RepID=UPI003CF08F5C